MWRHLMAWGHPNRTIFSDFSLSFFPSHLSFPTLFVVLSSLFDLSLLYLIMQVFFVFYMFHVLIYLSYLSLHCIVVSRCSCFSFLLLRLFLSLLRSLQLSSTANNFILQISLDQLPKFIYLKLDFSNSIKTRRVTNSYKVNNVKGKLIILFNGYLRSRYCNITFCWNKKKLIWSFDVEHFFPENKDHLNKF